MNTRRDFLCHAACAAVAAGAVGCRTSGSRFGFGAGGSMAGFAAAPLPHIRVGIVGCGDRGRTAALRFTQFPCVSVTALCDIKQSQIDRVQGCVTGRKIPDECTDAVKAAVGRGTKLPPAREFLGPEAYKALCESGLCDVVYNATPVDVHLPVCRKALECGLHCMVEVEMTPSVEGNWELVELAEKTRLHLMMLENCCYSKNELLMFNLERHGLLGYVMHGEAAYIHDCRSIYYPKNADDELPWRYHAIKQWKTLPGNLYPTHGLGPIAQAMKINRGDRMDYLISMSAKGHGIQEFARVKFGPDSFLGCKENEMVTTDMNTTLIRTVNGNTIMLQYATTTPRPYSRGNLLQGTRGIAAAYPLRVSYTEDVTKGSGKFFDERRLAEVETKYGSPLWKKIGKAALDMGHDGIDFLMDLRWIYCLHEGLPLDIDVYDSATWSCLAGLTCESVAKGGRPVDIPDFTRGGWKTAKPLGIIDCDVGRIGLKDESKA